MNRDNGRYGVDWNSKSISKFGAMKRFIILLFFILPFVVSAQTDILVLKRKGANVATYTIGSELTMQTVYNQWFHGYISDMRHDSIVINGIAFHYKEIAAVRRDRYNFGNTIAATGMMIAGGGIFLLGAVNGLYRKDNSKDWYTTSGLITGAALGVGGFLLTKTRHKTYHMGRRFSMEYLVLNPNKH